MDSSADAAVTQVPPLSEGASVVVPPPGEGASVMISQPGYDRASTMLGPPPMGSCAGAPPVPPMGSLLDGPTQLDAPPPQSQMTFVFLQKDAAFFCPDHDASEKRQKAEPALRNCTACQVALQTNYSSLVYCPACSGQRNLCMICGKPGENSGTGADGLEEDKMKKEVSREASAGAHLGSETTGGTGDHVEHSGDETAAPTPITGSRENGANAEADEAADCTTATPGGTCNLMDLDIEVIAAPTPDVTAPEVTAPEEAIAAVAPDSKEQEQHQDGHDEPERTGKEQHPEPVKPAPELMADASDWLGEAIVTSTTVPCVPSSGIPTDNVTKPTATDTEVVPQREASGCDQAGVSVLEELENVLGCDVTPSGVAPSTDKAAADDLLQLGIPLADPEIVVANKAEPERVVASKALSEDDELFKVKIAANDVSDDLFQLDIPSSKPQAVSDDLFQLDVAPSNPPQAVVDDLFQLDMGSSGKQAPADDPFVMWQDKGSSGPQLTSQEQELQDVLTSAPAVPLELEEADPEPEGSIGDRLREAVLTGSTNKVMGLFKECSTPMKQATISSDRAADRFAALGELQAPQMVTTPSACDNQNSRKAFFCMSPDPGMPSSEGHQEFSFPAHFAPSHLADVPSSQLLQMHSMVSEAMQQQQQHPSQQASPPAEPIAAVEIAALQQVGEEAPQEFGDVLMAFHEKKNSWEDKSSPSTSPVKRKSDSPKEFDDLLGAFAQRNPIAGLKKNIA